MANGVPEQKHHYNISWVLFAIVIAGCIVAYLYWKYQVPADRAYQDFLESQNAPEESNAATEGEDFGSELLEKALQPVQDVIPDEEPSFGENPLEDAYTNPFE